MYYNFAARIFLSQKLCGRLHSIEVDFYSKSSLFEPPFGRLRGNVRTSSIGRWKARVRLTIRQIELFSLALTVETLQAEICRRGRFSKAGGSLRSPILGRKGRRPPSTVGWQKTRRIALSCGVSPVGSLD